MKKIRRKSARTRERVLKWQFVFVRRGCKTHCFHHTHLVQGSSFRDLWTRLSNFESLAALGSTVLEAKTLCAA